MTLLFFFSLAPCAILLPLTPFPQPSFSFLSQIEVNGPNAHPVYQFLRSKQPVSQPSDVRSNPGSGSLEWNYVKFLVDRNGQPVKRYKPAFDPLDFEDDVRLVSPITGL